MRVRLLPSARNDLRAGRKFYERQGHGLGDYFFDSIFSDIDSLALYGGIHAKVFNFHRLLARRFPYAIYYLVDIENTSLVYRIIDCRKNPTETEKALRKAI